MHDSLNHCTSFKNYVNHQDLNLCQEISQHDRTSSNVCTLGNAFCSCGVDLTERALVDDLLSMDDDFMIGDFRVNDEPPLVTFSQELCPWEDDPPYGLMDNYINDTKHLKAADFKVLGQALVKKSKQRAETRNEAGSDGRNFAESKKYIQIASKNSTASSKRNEWLSSKQRSLQMKITDLPMISYKNKVSSNSLPAVAYTTQTPNRKIDAVTNAQYIASRNEQLSSFPMNASEDVLGTSKTASTISYRKSFQIRKQGIGKNLVVTSRKYEKPKCSKCDKEQTEFRHKSLSSLPPLVKNGVSLKELSDIILSKSDSKVESYDLNGGKRYQNSPNVFKSLPVFKESFSRMNLTAVTSFLPLLKPRPNTTQGIRRN